jgi:hypothetical protein
MADAQRLTSKGLRAIVDRALPEDGQFSFRTFAIPKHATGYNTGDGWVPLLHPGEPRCGVAVFENGKQCAVVSVEAKRSDIGDLEDYERELRSALSDSFENVLAFEAGLPAPHGTEYAKLTDEEFLAR